MAQISLYNTTVLESKVSLNPNQMDANIPENILSNLRAIIEGKSNENGIVLKVNRLVSHDIGKIDRINGSSKVDYVAKYECYLCSPIKDLEIICSLEQFVKGFLVGKNGPVTVLIQINNIDSQRFEIKNSKIYHSSTNRELEVGDYLKVSIINISNNPGENKILVISKLVNMANKDEISRYEHEKTMITGVHAEDSEEDFI